MKERLAKFIKNQGLTASKFAEIMEIPPSNVSHLLSGRNNPGFEFMNKMIVRFPDVNPDWLIAGNGPMCRPEIATQIHMPECPPKNVEQPLMPADADESTTLATDVTKQASTPAEPVQTDHAPQTATKPMNTSQTAIQPPVSQNSEIERIVIFYKNKSFVDYTPGK